MKFIFDFDDVLFYTTDKLIERIYEVLERENISRKSAEEYLEKEILNSFSLKKMLTYFSVSPKLYEEIMKESKNFVNEKLLEMIKRVGSSNCFIITYGDADFQQDKIERAGIAPLFSEIIVVSGTKKEAVEKICSEYGKEGVIFIDDSAKYFKDLDFEKYKNLKTILYDKQGLEKLEAILP